jgi:hypothetical protein
MYDNIPMAGKKLRWIEGTTARWDGYMEFQRRPDPLTLEQQYRRLTPPQLYTRTLAIVRMLKEPR